MGGVIKSEPQIKPDPDSLQNRIIELCSNHQIGITQEIISQQMSDVNFGDLVPILNSLQKNGVIEVLQTANKTLVWKLKDADSQEKMKGLELEEQLVYQAVKNSGRSGANTKLILDETKVPRIKLTRILKSLIKKQRIKEVNSPTGQKQKIYLDFDVEPAPELSWGSFYSGETGFEEEYVEVLRNQCSLYIENKMIEAERQNDPLSRRTASYATVEEIRRHISNLKISNVELSLKDMMTIMDCLVHDGLAEKKSSSQQSTNEEMCVDLDDESDIKNLMYRKAVPLVDASGLAKIPCGRCPVRNDCRPGGLISPEGCEYFREFLNF